MDPSRGKAFMEKLCSSPSFRGKFGGLYASVTSGLVRLGATDLPIPSFIQDKIAKARAALADKERLLDIMRRLGTLLGKLFCRDPPLIFLLPLPCEILPVLC